MQVQKINSAVNFKGLDITNVSTQDRENYINKDYKKLQEIGHYYDVKMTSVYSDVPNFAAIEIDVKPLKGGLNFFEQLIRPKGTSVFKVGQEHENAIKPSIVRSVQDAIRELLSKIYR